MAKCLKPLRLMLFSFRSNSSLRICLPHKKKHHNSNEGHMHTGPWDPSRNQILCGHAANTIPNYFCARNEEAISIFAKISWIFHPSHLAFRNWHEWRAPPPVSFQFEAPQKTTTFAHPSNGSKLAIFIKHSSEVWNLRNCKLADELETNPHWTARC